MTYKSHSSVWCVERENEGGKEGRKEGGREGGREGKHMHLQTTTKETNFEEEAEAGGTS